MRSVDHGSYTVLNSILLYGGFRTRGFFIRFLRYSLVSASCLPGCETEPSFAQESLHERQEKAQSNESQSLAVGFEAAVEDSAVSWVPRLLPCLLPLLRFLIN